MSKPFTPRKKKPVIMPVRQTKIVKIDSRTSIEVAANIPDEDAIERFYARNKEYFHRTDYPNTPNMPIAEEFKEIPVGSAEELAALVDDSLLPDLE